MIDRQRRATYQLHMVTRNSLLLLAVTTTACPLPPEDPGGTTSTASTTGDSDSAEATGVPTEVFTTDPPSTTTSPTTSDATTDADESTSTGSTTGAPVVICGDGIVEGDEECDGGWGCIDSLCRLNLIVFMSGASFPATELGGGVGGMKGADDACQLMADQGGLPGRYKAWLSTELSSPARRFARAPGQSYILIEQQEIVAVSWAALVSGAGAYGIDEDAAGNVYEPAFIRVWTATGPDGRRAPVAGTCGDWTSAAGDAAHGDAKSHGSPEWTMVEDHVGEMRSPHAQCDDRLPLYCFRQGDDCSEVGCTAARAACEDQGQPASCLDGVCDADPCAACEAAIKLCGTAPCPVARELCGDLEALGCCSA